jgi:hypothetical protein
VRLEQGAFAFYDADRKGWVAEKGDFTILVGRSSRDISLQGNYPWPETVFERD